MKNKSKDSSLTLKISSAVLAVVLCGSTFCGCTDNPAESNSNNESNVSVNSVIESSITERNSTESGVFKIQADAAVSYLGPKGTYTEEAAKYFFKDTETLSQKRRLMKQSKKLKTAVRIMQSYRRKILLAVL